MSIMSNIMSSASLETSFYECLLEAISVFLSVFRNSGGDRVELVHECIVLVENCVVFYFIVRTSTLVAIVN